MAVGWKMKFEFEKVNHSISKRVFYSQIFWSNSLEKPLTLYVTGKAALYVTGKVYTKRCVGQDGVWSYSGFCSRGMLTPCCPGVALLLVAD
jgi:hypothetical protein